MSVVRMAKNIKQVHMDSIIVVLFKIGSFYHAYSKDSYILSYLFEYKIKQEKIIAKNSKNQNLSSPIKINKIPETLLQTD